MRGCSVDYAYNEEGRLINGVIFFFGRGDDEIVRETFKVISASKQSPTSIVWNGYSFTPTEVLNKLSESSSLGNGVLGVRFTVYEDRLLKSYLDFLRKNYPAMLSVTDEIDKQIFGTQH